jgi:cytochrome P450
MMLNMDPPAHSRLRRLIGKGFTARQVERLQAGIRERARAIVDGVAARGECDFAYDVAADLPLLTLAEVMGVPLSDRRLLFDWANRIIGYQDEEYGQLAPAGAATPPVDPRSREALADMFAYAHALAEHKRTHPADDVITILLQAEIDGERLSDEEFENFFFLLAVAGNETLRNAVPGGMLALIEHPAERARLLADPSLLPTAVEEMLRWVTPVITFRRTATRDTGLAGVPIRAGDKVVVFYASANRDETVFANPDALDVGRTPNEHLTFGSGPHFCLGASLARLQMRVLFEELLRRLPDMELAGPVRRLQSNFQSGIKHMPVRFTPEPRRGRGEPCSR